MDDWFPVCKEQDLAAAGVMPLVLARTQKEAASVAIFRNRTGVFALEDRCPHRGGPLSRGELDGGFVYCPMHGWKIDLATGQAQSPGRGCAKTIAVQIQRGEILLSKADLDAI
jgi:nitrite reductase (NADH) small subunit